MLTGSVLQQHICSIIKFAGERTLKNANFGLDWQRNLAGTRQEREQQTEREFRVA
jgi:hypothetical protein